jgi:predicted ATPase
VLVELDRLIHEHPLWERFHAQLMLALFRCGRQSDALRAHRRARALLAEEVGLEPGPELRALERAVLAHDPSLAAPIPLTPTRAPDLPRPLTSFVGRATERALLQASIATSRLVSVVGPAGVGKTRLALDVAGGLATEREVRFVELAPTNDADSVDEVVAIAVGAPDRAPSSEVGGRRSPVDRTIERLGDRSVVAVLDNCEHLLDPVAELVGRLLAGCPALRIVTTTREPLGLDGEHQVVVGPLTDEDAATLFAERARAVQAGFSADHARVVELCRRLDGLPLAIELAAARAKVMTVTEITTRLDDRFELLVAPRRANADRQRALRTAIDWSYELLFEHEQWMFRRLSLFAGGFTAQAAEAVCGGDALEVVSRLVDKSLVVAETDGAMARYRTLESLRAYGIARLDDAGELVAAGAAYVEWCIALAEDAYAGIRTHDQLSWLDRLDVEDDNVRAALAWTVANDPDAGVRLIGALVLPWWCRGRGRIARQWLEVLLAASTNPPPAALARALTWGGLLADFGGGANGDLEHELDLADRRQARAEVLGRELGEELVVASARSQRGLTLTRKALAGLDVDGAEIAMLFESSLAVFEASGDDFAAGQTWTMRSVRLLMSGDLSGCLRAATRARRHALRTGDHFVLGRVAWIEGLLADAEGDVDAAYRHVERGLLLLDELGMGQEVTVQAGLLVALAHRRGEHQLAAQWEAFVAGRSGGMTRHDVLLQASARNREGLRARQAGSLGRAREAHLAALAGLEAVDVGRAVAFTESCLGFLAAEMDDPVAAAAHHGRALRASLLADDAGGLALALEGIAGDCCERDPLLAGKLLGAAGRTRADGGARDATSHRGDVDAIAARVSDQLGAERFAGALAHGAGIDRADVLALVRAASASA